MILNRILFLAVPCLLLAHGIAAAAAKKQGAQVSITTFKQPTRQAARPLVKRTSHRQEAPRVIAAR